MEVAKTIVKSIVFFFKFKRKIDKNSLTLLTNYAKINYRVEPHSTTALKRF